MSEGRPVFKAGVSVAPPTNWRYYDTVYTGRYMRTPQENAAGYLTNPIERVDNLHGALLMCHGMADDNVHPQNTFSMPRLWFRQTRTLRRYIIPIVIIAYMEATAADISCARL